MLVTGIAGGIGAATGRRFSEGGWRVAGLDQRAISVDEWLTVAGDVRIGADCARAVDAVLERFGRIDALVNTAGVWREGPVESMSDQDFDAVIDVNLKGTFAMCRAAIPTLRKAEGVIVNLSSDAGIQGNTGAAAYCASKGAVSLLTKALALELAPHGVRVNAVCPGDVISPMLQFQADTYGAGDPDRYFAALLAQYPQGGRARFIEPAEVAELIWFLAQPHAAAITGALVSIDFGLTAGK